jgi:hypothetical protein
MHDAALRPDRGADTVRTEPMGDQIKLANVVRVERDEDAAVWTARIGPPGQAIGAVGCTPEIAVRRLMNKLDAQTGWWWDSGWRDGANETVGVTF